MKGDQERNIGLKCKHDAGIQFTRLRAHSKARSEVCFIWPNHVVFLAILCIGFSEKLTATAVSSGSHGRLKSLPISTVW